MARGPEANFWMSLRKHLPKNSHATRIENKSGGGVPDVHILLDKLPFWLELKAAQNAAVRVSPLQIAWHTAYAARGGLSFFLVQAPQTKEILLFSGSDAGNLSQNGLKTEPLFSVRGPAAAWEALRPLVREHYANVLRPCGPAPASPDLVEPCGPAAP